MININNDIKQLLSDSQAPATQQWCEEAMQQYPYFSLPALLYLQRSGSATAKDNKDLLARLAIASSDRQSLYNTLGENADVFASFYPQEAPKPTPSTDNTIDTFLNTFGNSSEKELEVLNNLIFNPVPDYADILAAEEQQSMPQQGEATSKNDDLINQFIAKSKEHEGHFPSTIIKAENATADNEVVTDKIDKAETNDDSMFSESLAKIYIKQHKYSKALEIITNISLKFPEKSIYFADQIRFLRKLILNEQIKNRK